jgi:hypothetical protein
MVHSAIWRFSKCQVMPSHEAEVGMTLSMGLDANKVALLVRAALLDDASNMNERLAALTADIDVDDDEIICISLDLDLWPEDKEAPEVGALAKMMWLDIDWSGTEGKAPFAWPGMGEHAHKATEYFQMVIEAYRGQGPRAND